MEAHRTLNGPEFTSFASHFAPDGRAPRTGETWRSPDMAATLREIGATSGESFYTGRLASAIADFAAAHDAALAASDLASHRSEWVEPISARYRDHEVWEIPPNGQGIAALEALRILDGFPAAPNTPRTATWHREIEAIKLALTDAYAFVSDPEHVAVPVEELLGDEHVAARRDLISDRALTPAPRDPRESGTVYLCTADADGQMVSFIQSNFHGFGSHLVVPGTGVALQNRGFGFSLDQGHPNELAPGKRPFHTIIPGFLTQGGQPVGPFGVMGGDMQAQGHIQLVVDTVDHRTDPQTALGRPRFRWVAGRRVEIEPPAGSAVLDALAAHGHDVTFGESAAPFGRGQAIWRLPDGTLVAGTDPRADGLALGY
jgi:gamma-glutamyltranspeptidase/glutathione hydrolase